MSEDSVLLSDSFFENYLLEERGLNASLNTDRQQTVVELNFCPQF